MIHHMGVFASDQATSRRFYQAALEPLGIILGYEGDGVSEFWHRDADTPSLSLERADGLCTQDLQVAFTAADRVAVDASFRQGVAGGGTQRHAPRYWEASLLRRSSAWIASVGVAAVTDGDDSHGLRVLYVAQRDAGIERGRDR